MHFLQEIGAVLDEDADEILLRLQTVATHEVSTFKRAAPILPHWSCRDDKPWSPWPGNYTFQPGWKHHPYMDEVI